MSTILASFERLPQATKALCDNAITLARDDMRLLDLDSSMFLLAIINMGGSNESAKWLHGIGLRNGDIIRTIQKNFKRRVDEQLKDSWGDGHPVPAIVVFTNSANAMINRLAREAPQPTKTAEIALVLRAVVLSESKTVEQIFASVGLRMREVRMKLNIPSISGLNRWRAVSRY